MFIFKTIVTLIPQILSLHVQTEHPYQRQDKTRSCPVCNNLCKKLPVNNENQIEIKRK